MKALTDLVLAMDHVPLIFAVYAASGFTTYGLGFQVKGPPDLYLYLYMCLYIYLHIYRYIAICIYICMCILIFAVYAASGFTTYGLGFQIIYLNIYLNISISLSLSLYIY